MNIYAEREYKWLKGSAELDEYISNQINKNRGKYYDILPFEIKPEKEYEEGDMYVVIINGQDTDIVEYTDKGYWLMGNDWDLWDNECGDVITSYVYIGNYNKLDGISIHEIIEFVEDEIHQTYWRWN